MKSPLLSRKPKSLSSSLCTDWGVPIFVHKSTPIFILLFEKISFCCACVNVCIKSWLVNITCLCSHSDQAAGHCYYDGEQNDTNQYWRSSEPDKVTRSTNKSSNALKYLAPGANQPTGSKSFPTAARRSPRPRDYGGARGRLGALRGRLRVGPKVYISRLIGAKSSITLLYPYRTQVATQGNKVS